MSLKGFKINWVLALGDRWSSDDRRHGNDYFAWPRSRCACDHRRQPGPRAVRKRYQHWPNHRKATDAFSPQVEARTSPWGMVATRDSFMWPRRGAFAGSKRRIIRKPSPPIVLSCGVRPCSRPSCGTSLTALLVRPLRVSTLRSASRSRPHESTCHDGPTRRDTFEFENIEAEAPRLASPRSLSASRPAN